MSGAMQMLTVRVPLAVRKRGGRKLVVTPAGREASPEGVSSYLRSPQPLGAPRAQNRPFSLSSTRVSSQFADLS